MARRRHSLQKFIPNFSLEKHKIYAAAFRIKLNNDCLDKYYNYLIRFLKDDQISCLNSEDLNVFRHFVLDSDFGSIYVSFMKHMLRNINDINFCWTINILSKYIEFVGKISSLHQNDIFDSLFRDHRDKELLELIFKSLSPNDKIAFLEASTHYLEIMKLFPKFKLYLLFS